MAQQEPNKFSDMKDKAEGAVKAILEEYKTKDECLHYDQSKAADTTHKITEAVIKKLSEMYTTYKFTCTCSILNKKEGGLHMSSSCYWDSNTDGNILAKDENDALYFILNVFALY